MGEWYPPFPLESTNHRKITEKSLKTTLKPVETSWKPQETTVNVCILPENKLKSPETTKIRFEITIFSYLDPFFVPWPSTDFRYFFMIFGIFLWHPLILKWFPLVLCGFLQFSMVSERFQLVSKQFSVFFTGFHWFPKGLRVSALGYQLFRRGWGCNWNTLAETRYAKGNQWKPVGNQWKPPRNQWKPMETTENLPEIRGNHRETSGNHREITGN